MTCEQCGKEFRTPGGLKTHIWGKHTLSEEEQQIRYERIIEAARKGGRASVATSKQEGELSMSERGLRGGEVVKETYGIKHYSRMGKMHKKPKTGGDQE